MKFTNITRLAALCTLAASCSNQPTLPLPHAACAKLGADDYNCTGYSSPGLNVINRKGGIKLSIVSNGSTSSVQFSQSIAYWPNNYLHPTVTVQNGTSSSNIQRIMASGSNSSELYFDVPQHDAYTIKAYYIEYGMMAPSQAATGNLSTCINPNGNGCYRWYKMVNVPDGFYQPV